MNDYDNKNNNITTLVPTKSDYEIAAEFKKRFIEAYAPVLELLTEADKAGFKVMIGAGKGPLGNFIIGQFEISKIY